MKRDKSFTWRRVDAASLDLKGRKVAVVGGTGGIGRAFSRFMAARGASVVVVGQTFRDSDVPGIQFVKAEDVLRPRRRNDPGTRAGLIRSAVQRSHSAKVHLLRWACPGCPGHANGV